MSKYFIFINFFNIYKTIITSLLFLTLLRSSRRVRDRRHLNLFLFLLPPGNWQVSVPRLRHLSKFLIII